MYRILLTAALAGRAPKWGGQHLVAFARGISALLDAHDRFWQAEPSPICGAATPVTGQNGDGPRERLLAQAALRLTDATPFLGHLRRGPPAVVVGERDEVYELRLEFKGLAAEFDAERLAIVREAAAMDLRKGSQAVVNGVERAASHLERLRALGRYKDRFSFYCGPGERLPLEDLTLADALGSGKRGGERVASDFLVLSFPPPRPGVSRGEAWGRSASGLYHTLFHAIAAEASPAIGRWQLEGMAELYSRLCYELFLRGSKWGSDPEFRQHYLGRFPGGEYESYFAQVRDVLGTGDPPGPDDAVALGLMLAMLEADPRPEAYGRALENVAHYRRRVRRDRAPWSELELRGFLEQCSAPQLAMLRALASRDGPVPLDIILRGVGEALGRADFDGRAFAGTYAALQHRSNNLLREGLVEKVDGGYVLRPEYRGAVVGFLNA